jgi:hypothetical protein
LIQVQSTRDSRKSLRRRLAKSAPTESDRSISQRRSVIAHSPGTGVCPIN